MICLGCYSNRRVTPIFLNKAHRRALESWTLWDVKRGMRLDSDPIMSVFTRMSLFQTTFPVDSRPTTTFGPPDITPTSAGPQDITDISSQPLPPGPSLLASPVFPVAAVLVIVFVSFLLAIVILLIIRKCLVVSKIIPRIAKYVLEFINHLYYVV